MQIVSRRVGALEARLGVRLVERTTRSVSLTEAGRITIEAEFTNRFVDTLGERFDRSNIRTICRVIRACCSAV